MAGWNIGAIIEIEKEKNQEKHMWGSVILGQFLMYFHSVYASIPGDVGRSVKKLLTSYGPSITWVFCALVKYCASSVWNCFVPFV